MPTDTVRKRAIVLKAMGHPSRLAMLEALATGLPTIASDIGGVRDIIVNGRNGQLAPVNDAMAWTACLDRLVTDPPAAAEWGRQGRETVVRAFSIPHVAEQHIQLFTKVCAD